LIDDYRVHCSPLQMAAEPPETYETRIERGDTPRVDLIEIGSCWGDSRGLILWFKLVAGQEASGDGTSLFGRFARVVLPGVGAGDVCAGSRAAS
jgi:hypothetical protein